jgi:hypothetical protein
MENEEGRMLMFPKKKHLQPEVSKSMKAEIPEESLQIFADEYYQIKRIRYIRIPDGIFRWLKIKAPAGVQRWFFGMFGGYADNTLLIPIGKYLLAVPIELKTEDKKGRAVGALHGKQKNRAEEQNWIIARNQQQIIDATERAEKDAELLKEFLSWEAWRQIIEGIMKNKNSKQIC